MFDPKILLQLLINLPPLKLLIWHVTGWASSAHWAVMDDFSQHNAAVSGKEIENTLQIFWGLFLWNIQALSCLGGEIWYLFGGSALVMVVCHFLFSWKLGTVGLGYKSLHVCQDPEGTKSPWWPWQASPGPSTPHPLPIGLGCLFKLHTPMPSSWRLLPWIWSYIADWFPVLTSALPHFCGPAWWFLDLILTLTCGLTKWLDLGPASLPWYCLMMWTHGWTGTPSPVLSYSTGSGTVELGPGWGGFWLAGCVTSSLGLGLLFLREKLPGNVYGIAMLSIFLVLATKVFGNPIYYWGGVWEVGGDHNPTNLFSFAEQWPMFSLGTWRLCRPLPVTASSIFA